MSAPHGVAMLNSGLAFMGQVFVFETAKIPANTSTSNTLPYRLKESWFPTALPAPVCEQTPMADKSHFRIYYEVGIFLPKLKSFV